MGEVIADVVTAAAELDKLWGDAQQHPDGTDAVLLGRPFSALAVTMRTACERAARDGTTTWAHLVLRDVFAAMAETEPDKLRGELAQAAAVLMLWSRAVYRREPGASTRLPYPLGYPEQGHHPHHGPALMDQGEAGQ